MRLRVPRSAVALALIAGSLAAMPAPSASATPDTRPNIVVVMTDDERFDSLTNCLPDYQKPDGPGTVPCMPNVRSILQDHGVTFQQSYVSTSVCCPARASFLTGLYAHNHHVYTNESPFGGFDGFRPRQASTLATWLQGAGYRTGLIGKYLNGYYGPETPPGWDDWHAMFGSASSSYSNFTLAENGSIVDYSKSYHTTVLGQEAVQFVNSTPADQPLFLYFATHAPHFPFTPAKGNGHDYEGMSPWRPPSYDEANMTDKSPFWQSRPIPDAAFIANRDKDQYRQLETLEEVDRQIGNIAAALGPRLSNTLFVFTSDNGLTWGEHRDYEQKGCEFEECMRVPLVIRYDPLTGGNRSVDTTHPVQNIDLAPTIVQAAGITGADGMDGRSLLPLLAGQPPPDWRTAILGENFGSLSPVDQKWPPSNKFIETFPGDPDGGGFKYVEACDRNAHVEPCQTAFSSFYDENADPYEQCNRLSPAACAAAPAASLVQHLQTRLHALAVAVPPVSTVGAPPPTSTTPVSVSFSGAGLSAYRCSVDGAMPSPCVSPFTPAGQTHGPHTMVVLGEGSGGTSAPATVRWWISSRIPATPTFTSTPPSPSPLSASFSFTDSESGATFRCSLDGVVMSACTSSIPLSSLAVGQHTFAVFALDPGTNLSMPATFTWTAKDDLTPPALTMKLPDADGFLKTRNVNVQWNGSDSQSGIDHYEVTEQAGLSSSPVVVQSSPATTFALSNAPADTYCFQVTAFDREGNSKVGPQRCTSVALDDRALTYTGPTLQTAPAGTLDGTVTRLTGTGSTTYTCSCRAVGIMFRRGSDLGKAGVRIDGGSAKNVDLYSSGSKALWWTQTFANSGLHTVTVSWTGLKSPKATTTDVAIDGVSAIADAAPQPA